MKMIERNEGAAKEARTIHDDLTVRGCTHPQRGFGTSLGGAVLFELLKFEDLTFDRVFFEGVSFYEHHRCSILC